MTPDETSEIQEPNVDEQVAEEQATASVDEPAAAEQAQADADPSGEPPTDAVAEPAPLSETEQELLARLEAELGEGIVESASAFGTLVVRVKPDSWRRAAEISRDRLACDYLSFVSAIDWQPAPREGDDAGGDSSAPVQPTETTYGVAGSTGRFQVFAHVQSTAEHWGVTLKTDVDEARPVAESWVSVYPGADWHERECWEMFGVTFDGHPSLRHLYLPTEFEGHPLRKDFPLLARSVKPWPGLVDVEPMPGEEEVSGEEASDEEATEEAADGGESE